MKSRLNLNYYYCWFDKELLWNYNTNYWWKYQDILNNMSKRITFVEFVPFSNKEEFSVSCLLLRLFENAIRFPFNTPSRDPTHLIMLFLEESMVIWLTSEAGNSDVYKDCWKKSSESCSIDPKSEILTFCSNSWLFWIICRLFCSYSCNRG